jgi:hypothetical protein
LLGRIGADVAGPHDNREFGDRFHCAPLIEKRPLARKSRKLSEPARSRPGRKVSIRAAR